MTIETYGIDYFTIQITVGIIMAILGAFVYTLGRFYWKKGTINNINEFLELNNVQLFIEELKFNPLFWKTAAFSMGASIVIVLLAYTQVVEVIEANEHIAFTAAKTFALGLGMNFVINSAASGGRLSTIIQALLVAFTNPPTTENVNKEQLLTAKKVLETQGLKVHVKNGANENTDTNTKTENEENQ